MSLDSVPKVCLFFQAHQPYRTLSYDFFQIGSNPDYFDDQKNREILERVCEHSYIPSCLLFKKLHEATDGNFKFGFGLSGTLIKQLSEWRPDVLELFQELVSKGIAFLTGGMMTHSLASIFSAQEAARQIQKHRRLIHETFGVKPTVFANTELLYRDDMAKTILALGFNTILAEGVEDYLGHRSSDYLYHAQDCPEMHVLLRNGDLSDDVGFRFSDSGWDEHPLSADKFLSWITAEDGPVRNLFLDIETIGEHQSGETGIFNFWEDFIVKSHDQGISFLTPEDVSDSLPVCEGYSSPKHSSWADPEKDKSAWQANAMQQEASQKLFRLQQLVESSKSPALFASWERLQSADHFLSMSTKGGDTGVVHQRFREHSDPYDCYSYFMNILADLQIRSKVSMAKNILDSSKELLDQ